MVLVGGRGSSGWGVAAAVRVADRSTAVTASCVMATPAEQLKQARAVFDGTMLRGPVVVLGKTRFLSSPARARVSRYLKGTGPRVVRVQTGLRAVRNEVIGNSEGIEPRAGERWRIYSDSARQPFATSICSGSRMLRSIGRSS